MFDDMFFSPDNKSLRRGRRRATRTETCRPCVIWAKEAPDLSFTGVAINMNPFGMLVRMLDAVPSGTSVMIQLMRDEEFVEPLTAPIQGMVVRSESERQGFVDHGMELTHPAIERPEGRPVQLKKRRTDSIPARPRMHTMDVSVANRSSRRQGR